MSAVEVEHLTVAYDKQPVLIDASLTVEEGTLTCVLGPSGCGKTTLLRAVAGFEPARSGTISIGGKVVDDSSKRLAPERRHVGYVPQEGALFPHLTVGANVGFAIGGPNRAARLDRDRRVLELLDLVGMVELVDRMPHQLSGGQQQRVSVARALASDPTVVLLDEPFASLDAALRDRLRHDIRDVLRAAGTTAILVTHDRAEALSLGDQVAIMRDGKIIQAGPPRELYRQPVDIGVATFVGEATVLQTVVDPTRPTFASTVLGEMTLLHSAAANCQVVVRPEQVCMRRLDAIRTASSAECAGGACGAAAEFAVGAGGIGHGTVRRVEYYGHDARVDIDLDATFIDVHGESSNANGGVAGKSDERPGGPIRVIARLPGSQSWADGDRVVLHVDSPVWPLP